MKNNIRFFIFLAVIITACQESSRKQEESASSKNQTTTGIIGKGRVPDVAASGNTVHLAWGKGDSVLYAFSTDQGNTFSAPEVVDTIPKLFSFAMRGPQIAAVQNGACVIACDQRGNLIAYQKTGAGKWVKTTRVNDVDTTAKEGFLDLSSDGNNNLFAAWLDLRQNKQNNIFGARSADGGKTWTTNRLLYRSPEGHVCECCKPSVVAEKNSVVVMFRNWVNGYRDLWLLRSQNGGESFQPAEKVGKGSWKLDGCPMDGGGLVVNNVGDVQTVWRRKDTLYTAKPGEAEVALATGKNCTVETFNGKAVYAYVENGEIVLLTSAGKKQHIGKGTLPVLKAVAGNKVICLWETSNEIQKAVVEL